MYFTELNKYNKVLVTGPQRSGTRIAAKMIAHDTDLRYVDETEFSVHSEHLFYNMVNMSRNKIVVQCPGMCHIIHNYGDKDTMIVMMIRDIEDILASAKRIGWGHGYFRELLKYGIRHTNDDMRAARDAGIRPCRLKYEYWERQKKHIANYIELEYESLSDHPLWIPKDQRKNFTVEQTE